MDKVVVLEKSITDYIKEDATHRPFEDPEKGDLEDVYEDHPRFIPAHHKAAITRALSDAWAEAGNSSTSSLPEVSDGYFVGNRVGQMAKARLEASEDPVDREILAKHFQPVAEGAEGDYPPSVLNNGNLQRRFLRVPDDAVNPTLTKNGTTPRSARGDKAKSKNIEAMRKLTAAGVPALDWLFSDKHAYRVKDPLYSDKDGNPIEHVFNHDEYFDHIGNEDEDGNIVAGIQPDKAAYLARLGGSARRWYRDFSQDLAAHISNWKNPSASPEEREESARKVNSLLRVFGYSGNRTPVSMNYPVASKVLSRHKNGLLDEPEKLQEMRDAGIMGSLSAIDLKPDMQKATSEGKDLSNINRKLREYTNSFLIRSYGSGVDPVTGRKIDSTRFGSAIDEWMRRIYSGRGAATKPREQDHIQGQMNALADRLEREDKGAGSADPSWEGNALQAAMWVGNKEHIKNKTDDAIWKLRNERENLEGGSPLYNEHYANLPEEKKEAFKAEYAKHLDDSIKDMEKYKATTTGGLTPEGIFDMYDRWGVNHSPEATETNKHGLLVPSHAQFKGEGGNFKEFDPNGDQSPTDFLPKQLTLTEQRVPPVESNGQVDWNNQPEDVGRAKVMPLADFTQYKRIAEAKAELHEMARSGFISHSFPKMFGLGVHPNIEERYKDDPEGLARMLEDSVEEYKRKKRAKGDKADFATGMATNPTEGDPVSDDDEPPDASEAPMSANALRHSLDIVHALPKGSIGATGLKYKDDDKRHSLIAQHAIKEDMMNHATDRLKAGTYRRDEFGGRVTDESGNPTFDELDMPDGVENAMSEQEKPNSQIKRETAFKLQPQSKYFDAITLPHGEEPLRHAIANIDPETGEPKEPTEFGKKLVGIYRHEQVATKMSDLATRKRKAFSEIEAGAKAIEDAKVIRDPKRKAEAIGAAKIAIAKAVKARNKLLAEEQDLGYANPMSTYTTEGTARPLNYLGALANDLIGHQVPHERIKLDESLPYEYDTKRFADVNPFEPTTLAYDPLHEGGTASYVKDRFTSKGIGTRQGDDTRPASSVYGDRDRRRRAVHVIGILVKAEGQGDSQAEDILSASQQISQHPNCRCYLEKMGNGFRWVLQDTACHDCMRKAMEFNSRNYPDPVVQDADNISPQPAMRQGWSEEVKRPKEQFQEAEQEGETEQEEPQPVRSLRGNWGREMGGGAIQDKVVVTTPKAPNPNSYRQRRGRGR